ncbi:MAG: hypothetical protein AAF902_23660 [Chloroflexota bacterium]
MVTKQESEILPKQLSRFAHGLIAGIIFIFYGLMINQFEWINEWVYKWERINLDSPESYPSPLLIFIVGMTPLLSMLLSIILSMKVVNLSLRRFGYAPITFFRDNRRINGTSMAGCASSFAIPIILMFIGTFIYFRLTTT